MCARGALLAALAVGYAAAGNNDLSGSSHRAAGRHASFASFNVPTPTVTPTHGPTPAPVTKKTDGPTALSFVAFATLMESRGAVSPASSIQTPGATGGRTGTRRDADGTVREKSQCCYGARTIGQIHRRVRAASFIIAYFFRLQRSTNPHLKTRTDFGRTKARLAAFKRPAHSASLSPSRQLQLQPVLRCAAAASSRGDLARQPESIFKRTH